ncbi:MAG: hypothetical protein GX665_11675 [Gammaproteobacteria bacterium]|nr:hypothetical protein [Gammaproteobacteria bacterium]
MSQSSILGSLLNSVFKRKVSQASFSVDEVTGRLRLRFPHPEKPAPSIHWKHVLHLQQLVNLPSNALSGPVQEDKAQAYRYLKQIVSIESCALDSYDLRQLYGLNHTQDALLQYDSWEALSQAPQCKQVRIISIRDFNRTLSEALGSNQHAELISTAWMPDHFYWASTDNSCQLASALVYARRRELPVNLPAHLHQIRINVLAVRELQQHYHMLGVPAEAWMDPDFMSFLTGHKTPYARFSMLNGPEAVQIILLPRDNPQSHTFGLGLLLAGAREITELLLQLADTP